MQEMQVQSLLQEDTLEKEMAIHSSILGKSHGQRSLVGYSPQGQKRDIVWQLNNNNNFLRLPEKVSFPIEEREIRGNVSLLPSFLPPSPWWTQLCEIATLGTWLPSFFFNWRITALHCCVSFCCTIVWISYRYTYIPSLSLLPTPIPSPCSYLSRSSQSTKLSSLCYTTGSQ